MAETLYPQRTLCKTCRKKLGAKGAWVYAGLYCSMECAGHPPRPTDPATAPRQCVTQRDGQWVWKRRYQYPGEISKAISDDPSVQVYLCTTSCLGWHVGHNRVVAESTTVVRTPADLGAFLAKRRGRASVKDVAAAAGVRPIRVTELEAGTPHQESLATLFKVAKVLRVELSMGDLPQRR